MKFIGLCLGVFAAAIASTFGATPDPDLVEVIYFNAGKNTTVWPAPNGEIADIDGYVACNEPVFFIPGFLMGRNNPAFIAYANICNANSKYNCFIVNYNNARLLTAPHVGVPQIQEFLEKLMAKYSFDKSHINLISFSLGTVMSGAIGRALGGVGKIIAFDPCGLQFDYLPNELRLDGSDADTLVCVHTSDLIGTKRNKMCDMNLIWDGGNYPKGCPDNNLFCGHIIALQVLAEAISHCQFDFTYCESYESFKSGECASNPTVTLDINMEIKDGQPTVGAQYFYDPPDDINISINFQNIFVGSLCSKTRTVSYDGEPFC